ncbi:MAG: S41 family peptidase [Chitinophagaceae bacterium]|nr:S41 family peptidase [Chitinophagaceae bacterium]
MQQENKKFQPWLPLLFALVLVAGIFIGYKLRENTGASFFKAGRRAPLQEVIDLVRMKYVDSVNTDTLADIAIQDILLKLDPHSIYIPPVELPEMNEDLQGNFQGIGVEFHIYKDTVNVINVLEKGPSEKAGLQVGDQFIKVGDSLVAGNKITGPRIKNMLRGPGSSMVEVTLLRAGRQQNFSIRRGVIPLPSLDASYMVDGVTGFIRLNKFSENTYEEFMQALEDLQRKGMKQLILDLRGNGGGILSEAVDIADEFLDEDKLILSTKGSHVPIIEYRSKRPGLFEKGQLAVLIDESSASASEILVGAIQDWDRGTVIGRRSFGKGLVQEQYELNDGAALRLTVARYYTPSGRSIQKPYTGNDHYGDDLMERYEHGELVNADSNKVITGKAFKTSKGRTVYGSGGIMPDVFVPFDTTAFSSTLAKVFTSNTLSNFVYRYYIVHKNELKTYSSASTFAANFRNEGGVWNEFLSFAAADSLNLGGLQEKEKLVAQRRLEALLARLPWRTQGFYEVINRTDPAVQKALEVLK